MYKNRYGIQSHMNILQCCRTCFDFDVNSIGEKKTSLFQNAIIKRVFSKSKTFARRSKNSYLPRYIDLPRFKMSRSIYAELASGLRRVLYLQRYTRAGVLQPGKIRRKLLAGAYTCTSARVQCNGKRCV